MNVKLNKILIEYTELGYLVDLNTRKPIHLGKLDNVETFMNGINTTYFTDPNTLKYFSLLLIRNCADKIYVIGYGYRKGLSEPLKYYLKTLPEGLKNRVKIIDKNNHCKVKILNFLKPIYTELDNKDRSILDHIGKFFHKISLGCKYNLEIEINNFEKLYASFNEIRKQQSRKTQILYIINYW